MHEATDRIRETVDEIKPKLRGWLHAVTLPLAFFAFIVMLVIADDILGGSASRCSWSARCCCSASARSTTAAPGTTAVKGVLEALRPRQHLPADRRHLHAVRAAPADHDARHDHAARSYGVAPCSASCSRSSGSAPRAGSTSRSTSLLGWAAVLYFPEFVDNASTAVLVLLITRRRALLARRRRLRLQVAQPVTQ